jgi:hypothetical protein
MHAMAVLGRRDPEIVKFPLELVHKAVKITLYVPEGIGRHGFGGSFADFARSFFFAAIVVHFLFFFI